jgi:hypothetical protein
MGPNPFCRNKCGAMDFILLFVPPLAAEEKLA